MSTETGSAKQRALFVSHRGRRCGVHHFGVRVFHALSGDAGGPFAWQYVEVGSAQELSEAVAAAGASVVLFNHHPATLPFVDASLVAGLGATTFGILHECAQDVVDKLDDLAFDYLVCPDPTLVARDPRILSVPRVAPAPLADPAPLPSVFTVGSFGFATPGKGFGMLCRMVNDQFDEARIRINIPPHDSPDVVPTELLDPIVAECRAAITKPGIVLELTHDFFGEDDLLRFLAGNTINAFMYDQQQNRGIASCTDHAIVAGRPIAVSDSSMFRNLHAINPTIDASRRSLAAIAADGIAPLAEVVASSTPAAAGATWNARLAEALEAVRVGASLPDGRGFNKLLDDRSREAYQAVVARMDTLAPDVLARKIPRANVQQAFALDAALRLLAGQRDARILAVGSYDDTAVASLKALGYVIDEADPDVNGLDLEGFYMSRPEMLGAYDLILCVSVLEHVPSDELFVRMVGDLLAPGGAAVFTVDYSEAYPKTSRKPDLDVRLYTRRDLRQRLMIHLPDCVLVDPETWSDGDEDFEFDGVPYAFASWVFRRRPPAEWSPRTRPVPAWAVIHERLRQHADLGVAALRADAFSAAREIAALRASTSWRLTRPLRVIGNWLGRRRAPDA